MLSAGQLWKAISWKGKQELVSWMALDHGFFKPEERQLLSQLAASIQKREVGKLPELTSEMKTLALSGKKIAAIKLYRDYWNTWGEDAPFGLYEAKIKVEAYIAEAGE